MDTNRDEVVPVVYTLRPPGLLEKVQSSMRVNPMMWAGIAAGSGFAIGLIGRIAQMRAARRNRLPQVLIVETSY